LLQSVTYHPATRLRELYGTYVQRGARVEKRSMMAQYGALLMLGDMTAAGECLELAAFEHLREGNDALASNVFDSAATAYYLRGLWNAGYLNELAAQNVSYLRDKAMRGSMMM